MYSIDDYNYSLPEHLIAQRPAASRDQSRLMVLDREQERLAHHTFADIAEFLLPGDLLVINNTRVVPARLFGSKETGGKAEVLILSYPADAPESSASGQVTCECLVKTSKPPQIGSKIVFDGDLQADVLDGGHGRFNLRFRFAGDFESLLDRIGRIPLPPYIIRDETKEAPCDDRACYQTVYAEKRGAVAAPTAGLHFSQHLLERLVEKGVEIVPITLHVGYGTFLPVRVLDIREHHVHPEAYELTQDAAVVINRAKDDGRRIIGVGTTTVRVLEFAANGNGRVRPGSGQCDLFVLPGFEYRIVDALLTNFHLPKTSLLMLVAAFAGRGFMLSAYEEAIRLGYRFYSYGDAMLIL
ncbi:MAG: tRNA preQ1(34) S-adenosylmethionine ribosyltransferase-isomerase QueA [Deltaproteobacteria bacterium]|nr:tRNA preQ1(34) S-adenosylmethionine ribosyltransferase-isomerase QueA [Deltaproteobacteria bacterium]